MHLSKRGAEAILGHEAIYLAALTSPKDPPVQANKDILLNRIIYK
jgi:hypothetical protein